MNNNERFNTKNEEIIKMFLNCDKYYILQNELKKVMSDAIFQMSLARKHDRSISNIDNIRFELDANVKIDLSNDGKLEIWETRPMINPILLISGMPNPHLKNAKSLFSQALHISIALGQLGVDINTFLLPSQETLDNDTAS